MNFLLFFFENLFIYQVGNDFLRILMSSCRLKRTMLSCSPIAPPTLHSI